MKNCIECGTTFADDLLFCPRDGAPLREAGELGPGVVVCGKYRIVSELGRGGMGIVWRATHLAWGEDKALKALIDSGTQAAKAFVSEARVLRHLSHPSIVHVDDIDTAEDGQLFVVMELIEGESLRARLQREGTIPPQTALTIAVQLCDALAHAHQKGVLHRDIKPQNILLTRQPDGADRVKLIDFGIAKVRDDAPIAVSGMMTAPTGYVIGTAEYASPEQAMGTRGDDLDGRTDLYSLGLVLYEMLAGKLPFAAETPVGLLVARLKQDPMPLEDANSDVRLPSGLSSVVMRALAREREYRFASAEDMRGALERILPGGRTEDRAPRVESSAPRKTTRLSFSPRNYLYFCILIAALAGVGFWLTAARRNSASEAFVQGKALFDKRDYVAARPWFEKAAAAGNADAMNGLGFLYAIGESVPQNYTEARQWYEKAVAGGSSKAMANLGLLYDNGKGVTQDFTQARQWYEKAAAAGNANGMSRLGILYHNGDGVKQDYKQARQWYEKAVAAGDTYSLYLLGRLSYHLKDYKQAYQWHEKAVAAGNMDSMFSLGLLYDNGLGIPQDPAKAQQWYEKAAAAGNANAMFNLGVGYKKRRDFDQARQWYEKAAAAGDAEAMAALGTMYRNALGVAQDDVKGRQWYEKGAAAGNAEAMWKLAYLYDKGLGGQQDDERALQLYEKAAAAGNVDAMYNLGSVYSERHNYTQARHWYEKAAAAGDVEAMNNLGAMYAKGQGVTRDVARARQWYEKAAGRGSKTARANLARLK